MMVTLPAAQLASLLPSDISCDVTLYVGDLILDSRAIKAGDAFVCLNAMPYIDSALAQGASCVLLDVEQAKHLTDAQKAAVSEKLVLIPKLKELVPQMASARYLSDDLAVPSVIGVTGTNGKSSVVAFIAQLLATRKSATIGTLGVGISGEPPVVTGLTTPDVLSNFRFLAQFARQQVRCVAMEVSSHGLSQGRTEGLPISTAVFTNLTQDHLDYHGSFKAYGAAKLKLFQKPSIKTTVLNKDDPFCEVILAEQCSVNTLTYGITQPADVMASNITTHAQGVRFDFSSPWGRALVSVPVLGVFNIYNVLAAMTVALNEGAELSLLVRALGRLQSVAGRMQRLDAGSFQVVVDYAHTPDGIEQALKSVREHTVGRVIVVFGCGGDRDLQKRALMGAIAEDLADQVVLTSDNPRSEPPQKILQDIASGCKQAPLVIEDRKQAIEHAIDHAVAGDCILIAGKGHEDYQIIGDTKVEFSDLSVAKQAIAKSMANNVQRGAQ